MFCINALHHFDNPRGFFLEVRRVLRPGGGVLSIGLDPHSGSDSWWIYDYFPSALTADLARYPSAKVLRALLHETGFSETTTELAQHIPAAMPFETGVDQGFLDRRSTSQLQIIDDQEWNAGRSRLFTERPELRADLRLWATMGWTSDRISSLGA